MPVSFCFLRPGRVDVVLSIPALTSQIAGYVTHMSGGVGGALSDGRPYPYRRFLPMMICERGEMIFYTPYSTCEVKK